MIIHTSKAIKYAKNMTIKPAVQSDEVSIESKEAQVKSEENKKQKNIASSTKKVKKATYTTKPAVKKLTEKEKQDTVLDEDWLSEEK